MIVLLRYLSTIYPTIGSSFKKKKKITKWVKMISYLFFLFPYAFNLFLIVDSVEEKYFEVIKANSSSTAGTTKIDDAGSDLAYSKPGEG